MEHMSTGGITRALIIPTSVQKGKEQRVGTVARPCPLLGAALLIEIRTSERNLVEDQPAFKRAKSNA